MGRTRLLALVGLVALLGLGCSTAEAPAESSDSSSTSTTAVLPSSSTTSTSAVTSTSSVTTTTVAEREFLFQNPVKFEYITEPELPPLHGLVSPGAAVSVNDSWLVLKPSHHWRGWWEWSSLEGLGEALWPPLARGENILRFVAVFEDGDTLRARRTIVYDPTLTQRASMFLTVVDTDPATVQLEVGTYEQANQTEDAGDIGDSETLDVLVAHDAVFKMLSADGWTHHGYDFDGLMELLAFIDDGNCVACDPNLAEGSGPGPECPERCTWTSWGYYDEDGAHHPGAGPYGYLGIALLNTDGDLQQFTQTYDP